jgi:hypothetical protein
MVWSIKPFYTNETPDLETFHLMNRRVHETTVDVAHGHVTNAVSM